MGTRVDTLWREERIITVCTAKSIDTLLENVTERRSKGNNACTMFSVSRKI